MLSYIVKICQFAEQGHQIKMMLPCIEGWLQGILAVLRAFRTTFVLFVASNKLLHVYLSYYTHDDIRCLLWLGIYYVMELQFFGVFFCTNKIVASKM